MWRKGHTIPGGGMEQRVSDVAAKIFLPWSSGGWQNTPHMATHTDSDISSFSASLFPLSLFLLSAHAYFVHNCHMARCTLIWRILIRFMGGNHKFGYLIAWSVWEQISFSVHLLANSVPPLHGYLQKSLSPVLRARRQSFRLKVSGHFFNGL